MRIHLLSDLHNEFGEPYVPSVVDADVTILAGDIDVKGRGVEWAERTFSGRVLYIPGNHEFYKGNLEHTLDKMKSNAASRVAVLDRDEVIIDGVRFLGAIGWTDFEATGNQPLAELDAHQRMYDYKAIRHKPGYHRWTPADARYQSLKTVEWLREKLEQPFDGKTIVITHHAPSMMSIQGHKAAGSHLDASYVNRWEEKFFGEKVFAWCHGHTHYVVDYTLYGTRVISNPRGYPAEPVPGFNPHFILEV